MPVVVMRVQAYSSESAAYDDAKTMVYHLTKVLGTRIGAFELGNEYDLYCLNKGENGASPADYDTGKYNIVRGLISGMLAGLHEGSPTSSSIVQTTQSGKSSVDTGFLLRLIQDGINFDITGYHYYDSDGRIPVTADGRDALQVLHDQFHKPIWITEFDRSAHGREGPSANPAAQATALKTALNEIAEDADKYGVAEADIYELLDEPELLKDRGINPAEAHFGILDAEGGFTLASRTVQEFLASYSMRTSPARTKAVVKTARAREEP